MRTTVRSTMGPFKHHRHCGQFRIGEDVGGHGDREILKSALGGHSRNGIIIDPSLEA